MNSKQIGFLVFVTTCLPSAFSNKWDSGNYFRLGQGLKEAEGNKNQDGEWNDGQQPDRKRLRRSSTSDPFDDDFFCNTGVDSVVGGKEAVPYSQPWMAYIVAHFSTGRTQRCGATVISDQWVISAGHCFRLGDQRSEYSWVTVAVHDISDEEEETPIVFKVSGDQIFIHKDFVLRYLENDIALLQLPERIPPGHSNVRPACLPISKKDPEKYTLCIASGWGLVSLVPRMSSDQLQTITVQIVGCDLPAGAESICATKTDDVTKDQDTCLGDSGGPLIFKQGRTATIIGVLSTGHEECDGSYLHMPTLYTRVSYHIDWIEKTVEKNMKIFKDKKKNENESNESDGEKVKPDC